MLEEPPPTLEETQEAQATFRTCMSYLTDGEGNLNITPELIRQVGVPLFRAMDVMARFTKDSEVLAQIQDIRERAMDFMWTGERSVDPPRRG